MAVLFSSIMAQHSILFERNPPFCVSHALNTDYRALHLWYISSTFRPLVDVYPIIMIICLLREQEGRHKNEVDITPDDDE